MEGALNSGSFEDKMRTEWYNEYNNEQPLKCLFQCPLLARSWFLPATRNKHAGLQVHFVFLLRGQFVNSCKQDSLMSNIQRSTKWCAKGRTQAGRQAGRTGKQQQEQISPNLERTNKWTSVMVMDIDYNFGKHQCFLSPYRDLKKK